MNDQLVDSVLLDGQPSPGLATIVNPHCHRAWLTPTPSAAFYTPRQVDRSEWQHRVELPARYVSFVGPIANAVWMRNPNARNLERREGNSRARIRVQRMIPAYPATASDVPHWADVSGLETVEDRRKARNAMRRRRQGRWLENMK